MATTTVTNNVTGLGSDSVNGSIPLTNREKELRKLLSEERNRSEQRKDNYLQLRDEQIKLRKDYLTLQSEIKSILEETKILKKQKDDELEIARKQLDDQEELIDKLRKELNQRDPVLIKQQLADKLQEPYKRLMKEKDDLMREYDKLMGELKLSKQKVEFVQKEMSDSIERSKLIYEAEVNLIRKEKEELRVKLLELTKTPEGHRIMTLTNEVETLSSQLQNKEKALKEATRQYVKIQDTIETLGSEQEKSMIEHERQIDQLRSQLTAAREDNLNLDGLIKHLRREKDKLKSEIKRYERDFDSHEKTLTSMEKTFDQEKERLRRLYAKEKSDLEIEKNSLVDQIKRFKIDLELKAERINCLEKTIETKEKEFQLQIEVIKQQESNDKSALERERFTLESRIAETNEEKNRLKNELDNCKRLLDSNCETRMNLEKEVMISKAKLESFQSFQDEVDRLRRNQVNCLEELDKVRSELTTVSAINKDLTVQLTRSESEYNRIKIILEEERKETVRIKVENDEMISKLRVNLDEERNQLRMKIDDLNCEIRKKHKEREEIKLKCKQYQNLVEKLQLKVKSLEDNLTTIKQSTDEMVPIKAYKELKKQYKDLKRKINDLPTSSNLVNLVNHQPGNQQPALSSISSQHCIKVNKLTREKQTTTTS